MKIIKTAVSFGGNRHEWAEDAGRIFVSVNGGHWVLTTREGMEAWSPTSTKNRYNDPKQKDRS